MNNIVLQQIDAHQGAETKLSSADRGYPHSVDRKTAKSLIEQFDISPEEFRARQNFLDFSDADRRTLVELRPLVEKHADEVVDGFYKKIGSYAPLQNVIATAGSNIERLKVTQKKYLLELFSGSYDDAYLESRLRIGVVHFKIGLGPLWYLGSYSVYTVLLARLINRHYRFRLGRRAKAMAAINKILSLDAQIAIDSYMLSMVGLIRSAVGTMESGVDTQMEMVNEQASAINQTLDTLDNFGKKSSKTLEMTESWSQRAEESLQSGTQGLAVVKEAVGAINEANNQIEQLVSHIAMLSESAQRIGKITDSVDALARQSKMLAINASIEAVHAGEAGQGFAVVATEVADLAEQSEQATLEVRGALDEIQRTADKATMASRESSERMSRGVDLVGQAGKAVESLHGLVVETSQSTDEISASVMAQASGIGQIAGAMRDLDSVARRLREQSDLVRASLGNMSLNLDRQTLMINDKK